jgi:hypothetical protein
VEVQGVAETEQTGDISLPRAIIAMWAQCWQIICFSFFFFKRIRNQIFMWNFILKILFYLILKKKSPSISTKHTLWQNPPILPPPRATKLPIIKDNKDSLRLLGSTGYLYQVICGRGLSPSQGQTVFRSEMPGAGTGGGGADG